MNARLNTIDPGLLKSALLVFFLLGAVGIGLAIISRIRRSIREPEDSPADLLSSLRDAYDAGDLDEAEFRRVRESLARREAEGGTDQGPPAVPRF